MKNKKNYAFSLILLLSFSTLSACNTSYTNKDFNESNSINSFSSSEIDQNFDQLTSNIEDTSYLEDNVALLNTETKTGTVENNFTSIEKFITASFRGSFDGFDSNKNGVIEKSELPEAPNSFKKMDRNKNDKLTFSEVKPSKERIKQMSGWVNKFHENLFNLSDTNDDKRLSIKELSASSELLPFKVSSLWNKSLNSVKKNRARSYMNSQQFSIFANNLMLSLAKKNRVIKPTRLNRQKRPVILVQGYAEPSWYFMYGIYDDLKKHGWNAVYPINLFPNITDITEQAKIVARKVAQIQKEQKVKKIDYVAHSMGGLIGRYYIQNLGGAKNIQNYVSIATPHYGTYMGWLGIGEAAKQMRPNSTFLKDLNKGNPIKNPISYTSIWTKTDEIVIPAKNAVLQGSKVMPDVKFTGHLLIMWVPQAYKQIRQAIAF